MLNVSESQWRYYRHWLIFIVAGELIMLIFNHHLWEIYLGVAALFFIGFLLRLLRWYPGQLEPLILDLSAVALAIGLAMVARALGESAWRYLLIFTSSGIIFPHFVYIAQER